MAGLYTVELVNNSGSSGKVYNAFSAKATVEGGGNTPDTVSSVVWFRSKTLGAGQRTTFKFNNAFYGFLGSKDGNEISIQDNQLVTVGSSKADGTILLLNKSFVFTPIEPDDDIDAPGNQQFKIATNATLESEDNVIGVSRGKNTTAGIIPVPTDVVNLKPNVTYTFTTSKALYIKATNYPERTIQTAPDASDKKAIKVEFSDPQKKKAVVTEDSSGNFSVVYSRGD